MEKKVDFLQSQNKKVFFYNFYLLIGLRRIYLYNKNKKKLELEL